MAMFLFSDLYSDYISCESADPVIVASDLLTPLEHNEGQPTCETLNEVLKDKTYKLGADFKVTLTTNRCLREKAQLGQTGPQSYLRSVSTLIIMTLTIMSHATSRAVAAAVRKVFKRGSCRVGFRTMVIGRCICFNVSALCMCMCNNQTVH